MEKFKPILLPNPPETRKYSPIGGGGRNARPYRDRQEHSDFLKRKFQNITTTQRGHDVKTGFYIDFEIANGCMDAVKSLDDNGNGQLQICNIKQIETEQGVEITEKTIATIWMNENKKENFLEKIDKYATFNTKKGKPRYSDLIDSINNVDSSVLSSFWMDDQRFLPQNSKIWCEAWISSSEQAIIRNFKTMLGQLNISFKNEEISFPSRTIMLVLANATDLNNILLNCDDIAEFRIAKTTASFWSSMFNAEQASWANDILLRTHMQDSNISVCILDTGLTSQHPLIASVTGFTDSFNVTWGNNDDNGHGTAMAGIIIYGDMLSLLSGPYTIAITHKINSVKILPPSPQQNPQELWGAIVKQSISITTINAPQEKQIFCCAVSARDTIDRGRPSSWSSTIDALAVEFPKLIILSAGNALTNHPYPDSQITDSIHDPAQAWNALTVGAYTQHTTIVDPTLARYTPIAQANQLSPFSTTSINWHDMWPIKPEIVMEGGNGAIDSSNNPPFTTNCDDMSLLTTNHIPHNNIFTTIAGTSASAAMAANLAARIQAEFPDYWAETIRALMVHSAEWPQQMHDQFVQNTSRKSEYKKLLRACGYGVPNFDRAVYCTKNSLTLISQAELQPFELSKNNIKIKEMHFYDLPWPSNILSELGEVMVEMRITIQQEKVFA